MARTTRSTNTDASTHTHEQRQHLTDDDDPESRDEEAVENEPQTQPAGFKGGLQRFQYMNNTTLTDTNASMIKMSPPQRLTAAVPSPSPTKRKRPATSPSPKKKRRPSSYAPPATYAHLAPLTDILAPNLITLFIGTNPGLRTAERGHAYAHPSNSFWKSLYKSGCTDALLKPEEDGTLPERYGLGNTNIVERATRDAGELSREEMVAGAEVLDAKVRLWRPESVCVVGKGIWEAVWRWRYGRGFGKRGFQWGWQGEEKLGKVEGEWEGARVFVSSSTSGLSASLRPSEKEAIWRPFGEWVLSRRRERGLVDGPEKTAGTAWPVDKMKEQAKSEE